MQSVFIFVALLAFVAAQGVLQPVPVAAPTTTLLTHEQHVTLFNAWKAKHAKSYRPDEEEHRFSVWKDNLKFVEEWNAKGKSHKVAMNHIADLTKAEFKAMLNGLRLKEPKFDFTGVKASTLTGPAAKNWTAEGYVTPVKNQGQCGSCYSFSATGSMEGAVFKKTGTLTSLSEQQIVDCSASYGNNGCNGGLMNNVFTYEIAVKGSDAESAYAYTAVQGDSCLFNAGGIVSTISSFENVAAGDETDLTNKLASVGPISIAIDASHQSFQLYSTGVYDEPECSSSELDHGVLATGYGSDNGAEYYIVKNSWGTSWGQSGYIWMSRNKSNQCGVATMASYPIA